MAGRGQGVIIMSTFPDKQSAGDFANRLVAAKLCACANIVKVRSIYSWKGKLEDQKEYIALFKTTRKSAARLKAEIARSHSYEVPEIVELEMSDVSKSYLSWLATESSAKSIAKNRNDAPK